jgi:hypothetical protein
VGVLIGGDLGWRVASNDEERRLWWSECVRDGAWGTVDRKWGRGSKTVEEGEIVVPFIGLGMARQNGGVDVNGVH